MSSILKLKNPIQHYAWGSKTVLARLMGKPRSQRPEAELWMGDHPLAPSHVKIRNRWKPLGAVARKRLPFLFKVLAVAKPLSLQAHPDARQAKAGFERENRLHISLGAPERCYKDTSAKPEMLYALSSFPVLYGFRKPVQILKMLAPISFYGKVALLRSLSGSRSESQKLRDFFSALMILEASAKKRLLEDVLIYSKRNRMRDKLLGWVWRLSREFPNDIGVLAPLYLNFLELKKGEAIFLRSRTLHSYLHGTGIELMANSDNVLRGGLTQKFVNPSELIRILNFAPAVPRILRAGKESRHEIRIPAPVSEFCLSEITARKNLPCVLAKKRSAEILICIQGNFRIRTPERGPALNVAKGESLFVPEKVSRYEIRGWARIFKAGAA